MNYLYLKGGWSTRWLLHIKKGRKFSAEVRAGKPPPLWFWEGGREGPTAPSPEGSWRAMIVMTVIADSPSCPWEGTGLGLQETSGRSQKGSFGCSFKIWGIDILKKESGSHQPHKADLQTQDWSASTAGMHYQKQEPSKRSRQISAQRHRGLLV